jgi:tyrosyl-DNA phosphodiesterase 1
MMHLREEVRFLCSLMGIVCVKVHDNNQALAAYDIDERQDSGRNRAAPHIKTYIRFGPESDTIDWVLVSSANLSKQAWGDANKNGTLSVSSYEIGVLVWPSLFEKNAVMVPAFKADQPTAEAVEDMVKQGKAVVGMRMPYSWPLQRYGETEKPWIAIWNYDEPDWKGNMWRR